MKFSADVNPNIMDPAYVLESTGNAPGNSFSPAIDCREWQGAQCVLSMLAGSPVTFAILAWYTDEAATELVSAQSIERANTFFGGTVPLAFRVPPLAPFLVAGMAELNANTSRLRIGRTDVPSYGCESLITSGIIYQDNPTVLNGVTYTRDLYPYYGPAVLSCDLASGGLGWTLAVEQEVGLGSGIWQAIWQDFSTVRKAVNATLYIPAKHCRLKYVNGTAATQAPIFSIVAAPQPL